MAFCPKKSITSNPTASPTQEFEDNYEDNTDVLKTGTKPISESKQNKEKKFTAPGLSAINLYDTAKNNENSVTELVKVSIITEFFPPDYAATGQLIEELVKQLEQQGVNIEVFTGQPGYAFSTANAPSLEEEGAIRIR
jgi:hypothetical protein